MEQSKQDEEWLMVIAPRKSKDFLPTTIAKVCKILYLTYYYGSCAYSTYAHLSTAYWMYSVYCLVRMQA